MLNFGLDLPFEVLESTHVAKVEFGFFYKHLPFGLVINTVRLGRPTGLFDEPGFIGTLAALFIAGAYGKVDKKWIYLLLFEGLSSFSMAFYLITILYFSTKMFEKGYRKLCFLLAGCVIIMIIFNTFTFTNPFLLSIQDRLAISVNIIFDNNRTLGSYDIVFKDFLDSGGYAILFGNGRHAVFNNALLSNSSTYKNLIYDYGVIGCMILVSFFVSLINYIRMDKRMLPFLLVFSISVYQRPNIFNLQMIALFTGALCLIVEDSKKNFFLTKQT